MLRIAFHALVFVFSSGLFFKKTFKPGSLIYILAGLLAVFSGIFTLIQIFEIARFIAPSTGVLVDALEVGVVVCAGLLSAALFFEIVRARHDGSMWWWATDPIEGVAVALAIAVPVLLFASMTYFYARVIGAFLKHLFL